MKNNEGFYCCLGLCSKQLGIEDKYLQNVDNPRGVIIRLEADFPDNPSNNPDFVKKVDNFTSVFGETGSALDRAININDTSIFTLPEKEKELKRMFKGKGHEIVFVGKSVPYKEEF